MSSTPREIGTLIVVVLKANHLPNKRHIGKQDPYCVVTVNGEKRRTKAVKRGGQHPEWDEEIRFTLYEDTEDVLARTGARTDGSPPPLPPKAGSTVKKIKGGKIMKLACYADDSREPDLIGEADVNLTEVLTKGETDEWFDLTNKDKFAGKVYLELTFWSNEPPPEKKVAQKPAKNNKQYGGPGMFIPQGERHPSGSTSLSGGPGPSDLYVAPYEQRPQQSSVDSLAQEFSEFGVGRRRESFPPVHGTYSHPAAGGYSGHIGDGSIGYGYEHPISAPSQSSGFYGSYGTPSTISTPSNPYDPHSTIRGPRHSIPTASSGFMPIANTSFPPVQPEPYPPFAQTGVYPSAPPPRPYPGQSPYSPQSAPPQVDPYGPSASYDQQSYVYPQYAASPQHYPDQHPIAGGEIGAPIVFPSYHTPPGHQDALPPQSNPLPTPPPSTGVTVGGSRPLPPQPVVYTQPPTQSMDSPQLYNNYSPSHQPGNVSPVPPPPSHPLPVPPPPPPPIQYNTEAYDPGQVVTPTPPPPPQLNGGRQRRTSALPQPPVPYHQQPQAYPPPLNQPNQGSQVQDYGYAQLPPPPHGQDPGVYQPPPPLPPPPHIPADDHTNWQRYSGSSNLYGTSTSTLPQRRTADFVQF
ncbi:hypothetical protein FA13DRAFT_1728302 [Coprinellus micaceus]|uniref:C2 domain-containing protein n=1 Tax=Coprinellus micaceus TaxID=71717 RepID=A0A4Y7TMS0_COPMI|nr:hypothetical protein FA13DRAFT_1728302 [Coprinellus micaceus]